MVKKLLISYLLVLCLSNSAVKADNGDMAIFAGLGTTALAKIISEAVTIQQLTKTTPKAVGTQAGTEITADLISAASGATLLGFIAYLINDAYGSMDLNQKVIATNGGISGVALLASSVYNIHKFRALLKNKKAIARYRNDPQVQAFLAKIKSKQRGWLTANYLLPIAVFASVAYGLSKAHTRGSISLGKQEHLTFGAFMLCFLASYISEQLRTAHLFKAANATEKKPLDIPVAVEEEEEEEEEIEEESDDEAQEESSDEDETESTYAKATADRSK